MTDRPMTLREAYSWLRAEGIWMISAAVVAIVWVIAGVQVEADE